MKRSLPPFSAIRSFEAAARHLSFKQAAEELHVTQSAISHQVRGLEDFLGTELFFRAPNGVTLTPAGEDYFGDLAPILDQLEASTRRTCSCEASGPLRVRATPAFAARWLLRRIKAFNARFPDIELQVTTSIATTDFRTDEIDILLQYGQQTVRGLRVDPFLASGRVPVCSPEMLAGAPPIEAPEELLDLTLLRDVVGDEWGDWFARAGVEVADELRGPWFEHCDLSLRAAEQGQGIALAYEALVADEIAAGDLVKLFDIRTSRKVIYSITCPECWLDRPKISAFRSWLFEETGQLDCAVKQDKQPLDEKDYIPAYPYSA